MDNKFSAYIVSNGSSDVFPDNTLSKFSVQFPFPLETTLNSNEKWSIAINSIGLSSKFENDTFKDAPVILQMVNLYDKSENCNPGNAVGIDLIRKKEACNYYLNIFNEKIYKLFGKCYSANETYTYCNIKTIKDLITNWALENLYYGHNFSERTTDGHIHQLNYYFNDLLNDEQLSALVTHIQESDIIVTVLKENLVKLSPGNVVKERLFFIRTDLVDRCTITQDTSFKNLNTYIRPVNTPYELFRNYQNARDLNKTYLTIGQHKYKLFVINDEFRHLNIEFEKSLIGLGKIPDLIKIKCDNIRSQVYNNTHSNDLNLIKPKFDDKGSHYFHEFENPLFIPLLNTNIYSLTFQLTDGNDKQLNLATGLPTILAVTFQKMYLDYKSFNIRLSPTHDIQENTSSSFKNILPGTFTFDQTWSVGLKDITFPNHFKNLPSNENEIVILKLNNEMKIVNNQKHKIPIANIRSNAQNFITYLNDKLFAIDAIDFSYDNDSKQVSIKAKTNAHVYISKNLAQLLGFSPFESSTSSTNVSTKQYWKNTFKVNTVKEAEYPINVNIFRPAFLMIYLDFVELSLVSGVFTNIIKIVPVKNGDEISECLSHEFKTVEFRRLNKNNLSEINTEIRDPAGRLVQFDSDKVNLSLFFTNNPFI